MKDGELPTQRPTLADMDGSAETRRARGSGAQAGDDEAGPYMPHASPDLFDGRTWARFTYGSREPVLLVACHPADLRTVAPAPNRD